MSESANYNTEAPYMNPDNLLSIDENTFLSMWNLFQQIHRFWEMGEPDKGQRNELQAFINNRINFDLNYQADYQNAATVINELTNELGEEKGYKKLFTDPGANISPPQTRLARARQKVSNEFISLALIAGGFKRYGAENYLGYKAAAYLQGQTPYRTIEE